MSHMNILKPLFHFPEFYSHLILNAFGGWGAAVTATTTKGFL